MRARQRALDLLETWYRGQGWYCDGDGRAFDHHNGWAPHLYPVLDAFLAGQETHHGERLREHLDRFALPFGADGAPIHFGRSLTYRLAASAAVALGALTGHTPLSPGRSRHLIGRDVALLHRQRLGHRRRSAQPRLARPARADAAGVLRPGFAVLGVQGVRVPAGRR
ncbi:DUF2264 domain-containing protein [Kibdelosporangium phytohabitans]|uniref:DUF2264 domain-containing protein n=1 Tax=Kibdelosporangium phytohabitans TaxID=860235 RepID=UPI000AEA788B|nr:DUF2264 domain-containing protein [Kibdelosporangium phytohabitans]MBE1470069.1 hypothetical protein [Kibdelosporangium phytohabitans]